MLVTLDRLLLSESRAAFASAPTPLAVEVSACLPCAVIKALYAAIF